MVMIVWKRGEGRKNSGPERDKRASQVLIWFLLENVYCYYEKNHQLINSLVSWVG